MALTCEFPRKIHVNLRLSSEAKFVFRLLSELSVEVPDCLVEIVEAVAKGTPLFTANFDKDITPWAVRTTGLIEPSEFLLKLVAAATSDFDRDVEKRFHERSPV